MLESAPVLGIDVNVTGTTDIKQIEGGLLRRHVGIATQTGMSRDDCSRLMQR